MSVVNMDKVVEAYISTRDEIDRLEKELAEKIKPLKEVQEKREAWMLNQLNQSGAQNMKTLHGTAYVNLKESVTVADWDAVKSWVIEGERWEYLEHRISKQSVLEYMGEKRTVPPPPGVSYQSIRTVSVRRS